MTVLPLKVIDIPSFIHEWIVGISSIICLIIFICLCLSHFRLVSQFGKQINQEMNSITIIISKIMIIGCIIITISSIMISFLSFNNDYKILCNIIGGSFIIGYSFIKYLLYLLLSFRLSEIFGNTIFENNKICVIFCRIYITVAVISLIILQIIYVKYDINSDNKISCKVNIPTNILIIGYSIDFIDCLIIFSLYMYSTCDLKRTVISNPNFKIMYDVLIVMKKQLLLVGISVISSIITIFDILYEYVCLCI